MTSRRKRAGRFRATLHRADTSRVVAEQYVETDTRISIKRFRHNGATRKTIYRNAIRRSSGLVVSVCRKNITVLGRVSFFFGVLGPPADCRWRTSAEGSLSDLLKKGFLLEVSKRTKKKKKEDKAVFDNSDTKEFLSVIGFCLQVGCWRIFF